MQVQGRIKEVFGTQNVSDKFKKREFVIETELSSPYPQQLLIQLTQDKCDLIDKCQVGDSVDVSINLKGRSWVNPEGITKYFNTIEAWRITKLHDVPAIETPPAKVKADVVSDNDDLPF